ncbi:hypothetical protein ACFPJ1_12065 [Kribbella qitaiheensis]|uniref:hypothetical protein n=1 Tax=Kribbella qitaiheensis TaxID=1544730 RepID=UPI0036102195
MARLEPAEYVALGRRAIVELLDHENAAAWREIEAKIADQTWPGLPTHVDPNHQSTARLELQRAGQIEEVANVSRGGREVSIVVACQISRSRPDPGSRETSEVSTAAGTIRSARRIRR